MIIQKDEIKNYIPKNVDLIFLGTMCAMNARTINGIKPEGDFFYYNDNRNHFWKILQFIYAPEVEPFRMSIEEKKNFLTKHKIGILNLVSEIQTPNSANLDPSDTVLFQCQKKKKILFKTLRSHEKTVLRKVPMFFTCRHKKGIENLMLGYLEQNSLSEKILENIFYLKTPTRCNPFQRSLEWKEEMDSFIVRKKS